MTTAAARAGPGPGEAAEQTLAVPVARAMAFLALCGFAALQWMQMLEPAATQRAGYAVLAAAFAICGLLIAGRLPGRARTPAAALVALAAFALAVLGGGAADEQLLPARWGELAGEIGRGLSTLPGARVPYRGLDDSTRLVIALGGTVLAVVAALLAFWPRRRELGFRHVALVLLVTLYAVPVVALDLSSQFLSGALLALLVVAYLRLERLQITDAGVAGFLAVAVTILGLAAAPALDTDQPWFDYETWALSNASSKSASFSWDHTYGPLDWPRDGRELLRVKAKRPAYWKAANLDDFDGTHWRRDRSSTNLDGCGDASAYLNDDTDQYLQRIRVTVRNLRTQTFIAAGVACAIYSPRLSWLPLGDGTYASSSRELRRGDAYGATVYTPNPNGRDRRVAPREYPATLQRYAAIELPPELPPDLDPAAAARSLGYRVQFPMYGDPGRPMMTPLSDRGAQPVPARRFLRDSRYARTYALAQRLRREAATQEDFVQSVLRYLGGDAFSYTESPSRAAENLDGFLFDAKSGYCQQYSGAMALLLRMGGVPARVSTGFTTGLLDRKAGEYVVRDFDAHSWVEVWYSGFGWVTFDPTPAAAPARSESDQEQGGAAAVSRGAPDLGGDIRSDPGRGLSAVDQGTPWGWIASGVVAALLAAVLAFWLLRRRTRMVAAGWGPVAELERALERTRRAPGPSATLSTVEALFARTPAAAGYVRALREQRYSGRHAAPTPSGRRAVRAELARGTGLRGRLRAWWALPPKPR
jgi:transglutaminase-like putative cysteine protease